MWMPENMPPSGSSTQMSPTLPPKLSMAVTTTPERLTGVPGAIWSFCTSWIFTAPLMVSPPPGESTVLLLLLPRHATSARPSVEKAMNEVMRMTERLPGEPRFRYIERGADVYRKRNARRAARVTSHREFLVAEARRLGISRRDRYAW